MFIPIPVGKGVSTAIEKLSSAIGTVYGPCHTRNVAKAEADAAKIKKQGELEVEELERRTRCRIQLQDAYHQRNLENIIHEAASLMDDNAKPEAIEPDWMANFLRKAEGISDDEMQNLWARVLAGKSNNPGTFSRRTVNLLADLDKDDAEKFANLCRYLWYDFKGERYPMIFDIGEPIYKEHGLDYSTLLHLETIGLIQLAQGSLFAKSFDSQIAMLMYDNNQLVALREGVSAQMKIGRVLLTKTGQELSHVCKFEPVEGYFDYIFNYPDLYVNSDDGSVEYQQMPVF